jgi:hypothetical protein
MLPCYPTTGWPMQGNYLPLTGAGPESGSRRMKGAIMHKPVAGNGFVES